MSMVYSWRQSDEFSASPFGLCCPHCECDLTLHQPDPDLPQRLLATCSDCKAWFLTSADGLKFIPPGLSIENRNVLDFDICPPSNSL